MSTNKRTDWLKLTNHRPDNGLFEHLFLGLTGCLAAAAAAATAAGLIMVECNYNFVLQYVFLSSIHKSSLIVCLQIQMFEHQQ